MHVKKTYRQLLWVEKSGKLLRAYAKNKQRTTRCKGVATMHWGFQEANASELTSRLCLLVNKQRVVGRWEIFWADQAVRQIARLPDFPDPRFFVLHNHWECRLIYLRCKRRRDNAGVANHDEGGTTRREWHDVNEKGFTTTRRETTYYSSNICTVCAHLF